MNKAIFPIKQEIIVALLNGLVNARIEFGNLCGYSDWQTWLNCPEYIVSTIIMQTIKQKHHNVNIWAELPPEFVTTSKKVRQGRIDIVLDNKNDEVQTVIEVKTNVGLKTDFEAKGIAHDIMRICEVVQNPINEALNYGVFAFYANRNDDSLKTTLKFFEAEVTKIAQAYSLKFTPHYQECGNNGWQAFACVYEIFKGS